MYFMVLFRKRVWPEIEVNNNNNNSIIITVMIVFQNEIAEAVQLKIEIRFSSIVLCIAFRETYVQKLCR